MAVSGEKVLLTLQDELVERAEEVVRALKLPKGPDVEKGRTQASKALEVAESAGSLPVFVNWLRYQAARDKSAEFWGRQAGDKPLAHRVTQDLGWVQSRVKTLSPDAVPADLRDVTMRAVTRYLGYLRRAMIGADYLDEIKLG